ncbi:MAG: sensor histidine kinase [Pseudomonadota bacterium]
MLSVDIVLAAALGYVLLLFGIAFFVDQRTRAGRMRWLHSPVIYTLSISVYCTSWTFYGAVGSAARNGLEFITIYLGPTLVFIGWWWLLRKLVRIGRTHRITSIADLISSRFGKSPSLAVLVTLIAVVATTPYIALQLQSLTRSYLVIAGEDNGVAAAFWIAAGMALFTILFGTRNLDANERHHGVVAAIAVEAIVKFVALFAVGLFAVYGISSGFSDVFDDVPAEVIYGGSEIFSPRWAAITFLSATAIICLPRQFQVTVVENIDERHLATASWLFPAYLFGMCIFVMPIAIVGLKTLPAGMNPDLYVLSLPLAAGREELALLAFLGGFSSATSMVIVAAIAVSTMVSNHIVMPVALNFMAQGREVSGDVRNLLLTARRISIAFILALGFLYYQLSGGSDALASIGLIAFVGVAQFMPSLLGGIFWRGATRAGALAGLVAGFLLWAYTLFLPSFGGSVLISAEVIANGPWGIEMLRPYALLGLNQPDPLIHALVWSLGINTILFLAVSALTHANPLEQLQGAQFVDVFRIDPGGSGTFTPGTVRTEDLFILAQRILGTVPAQRLFTEMARAQGRHTGLPVPNDAMLLRLERELAGSVGGASAHAMVGRIAGDRTVGMAELMNIASETQRLIETSRQLSEKSAELEDAATQLRRANDRLRTLDAQKDEFLSQVSHELRTPMTSIRSFSEILLGDDPVGPADRTRFAQIIHEESLRLTRLLDEILDISRLESGNLDLPTTSIDAVRSVQGALTGIAGLTRDGGVEIVFDAPTAPRAVSANADRLRQVLLNLLSNAMKYNTAEAPRIDIRIGTQGNRTTIDVIDNGGGINRDEAEAVFQKFIRGHRAGRDQGAGLGLPISRALMQAMGGDLTVEFAQDGTSFFRLHLVPANAADKLTAAEPVPSAAE